MGLYGFLALLVTMVATSFSVTVPMLAHIRARNRERLEELSNASTRLYLESENPRPVQHVNHCDTCKDNSVDMKQLVARVATLEVLRGAQRIG